MTVLRPSKNALTGKYTSTHRGYDHDDVPLKNYYASFDGKCTQVVNTWNTSWIANTPSDPWYVFGKTRPLTTNDYGNFLKIVSPAGITQLAAHFPKDCIFIKPGDTVKRGQVIGFAPGTADDTGNSTGGHTHTEYRNSAGVNIEVEFSTDYPEGETPMPENITVTIPQWERQLKGNRLGDRLINGLDLQGNIADKNESDIDILVNVYKNLKEDRIRLEKRIRELESQPATGPGVDLTQYEENGLTVETLEGNKKTIVNYKRKV